MLVLALDGAGIRSFSRAFSSVDNVEPEAVDGWLKSTENVRVKLEARNP